MASNKALFDSFVDTFSAIGAYQPKDELERNHLLDISKCFTDEFKERLKKYERKRDIGAIEELAKMCQEKMKSNLIEGNNYMMNNTMRLYAFCIKIMKRLVPMHHLKKNYL